ncbi:MAG: HEAT repeat domain-containing protein [Ktedonobacteraceae bacterium]
MDAYEIVHLLEEPTANRAQGKAKIINDAPIEEIITAMRQSTQPLTKQILCEVLGRRHAIQALPELLHALKDSSPGIRSEAADALAAIGSPQAGPALLEGYRAEEDRDVRVMLAIALGAVHFAPAIPDLIQALDDPYDTLQVEAAWSLGELKAINGKEGMQRVLSRQTSDYSKKLVQDAISKLS